MKKHILLTWLLAACSVTVSFGQWEGKKFVSGSADLNFSNNNSDFNPTSTNYGFGISGSFGKFKTNRKASGLNISTSLYGEKATLYPNGTSENFKGITGYGIGAGYFWQHYKHFTDQFGLFGGPQVNVLYSYNRLPPGRSDDNLDHKTHQITPQFGLSAGAYYTLNQRWWLTASLAFADLLYVNYGAETARNEVNGRVSKTKTFKYKITPGLTLPSVGLGLRYFFKD